MNRSVDLCCYYSNYLSPVLVVLFFLRHVHQLKAEAQHIRQRRQERSEEQTEEVHQQTSIHEDAAGERHHQRFQPPLMCLGSGGGVGWGLLATTVSHVDFSLTTCYDVIH